MLLSSRYHPKEITFDKPSHTKQTFYQKFPNLGRTTCSLIPHKNVIFDISPGLLLPKVRV